MMGKKDYDLTVNVMMVGGRRCGKTSVLASMQSCFEDQLQNTKLVIGPADYDILDIIVAKQQEMDRYFLERGTKRDFVPDDSPTDGIMEYPFYIGIKDQKSRICVSFIDYPGEMLKNKADWKTLQEKMEKSRILLVVIDTPHLMEEKGLYNDSKNLCRHVFEMIKDVGFADAINGPGMVLLVPLKCERYYNNKRINEVTAKVQEAYKPLIQYLQQPGIGGAASPITVAITPILTMGGLNKDGASQGGAEFSRFERNDEGDIDVDTRWGTPVRALYYFPDMSQDKPQPRYCEQPLLYILSFVFMQAGQVKKKSKSKKFMDVTRTILSVPNRFLNGQSEFAEIVLNWIQKSLMNWSSAPDYLIQADEINRKLKMEGDGYRVLNKGILDCKRR